MSDNNKAVTENRIPNIVYYILLAVALVIVLAVRIRLLPVPLERDEGEFAYLGQLMLKGVPPYFQAFSMKPPGIFAMYALSMLFFGQTSEGIHLGLLLVNVCTILLVFSLGKRLFNDIPSATFSAICFGFLSLSSSVQGAFAHATHFLSLFVVMGALFLIKGLSSGKRWDFYIAGLALGISLTMKQPALFFIIGLFVFITFIGVNEADNPLKNTGSTLLTMFFGVLTVILLLVICLSVTGVLNNFWFWTYQYPKELVNGMSLAAGRENFVENAGNIASMNLPLVILAIFGFALALIRMNRRGKYYLIFTLIAGLVAISPGLHFSPHYFVVLLPTLALCAGYGLANVGAVLSRQSLPSHAILSILLIVIITAYYISHDKNYLYKLSPLQVSRLVYGYNPFPESLLIAEYLRNNSLPSDSIAVIGSEPQIAFYANRKLASSFSQIYPLMENHAYAVKMQMQMLREIEAARPAYIVIVNVSSSWAVQGFSTTRIYRWAKDYSKYLYYPVGVIDIGPSTRHVYNAGGYLSESNFYVSVFKRKSGV